MRAVGVSNYGCVRGAERCLPGALFKPAAPTARLARHTRPPQTPRPKQLRKVAKQFGSRGVPLGSAQVQFSLLSCGPQQREVQETAAELGCAVIAYSPLALGLLTGARGGGVRPRVCLFLLAWARGAPGG